MALQGRQQRALLQVPDLERPVVRARDRAPPVRRHRHRPTASPWPSRVASSAPCSRSQTLSVRSYEPETARRPSGVTATALTPAPWPSRVRQLSAPCSRSQTFQRPVVHEPETARRPSGVTATALTRRHGPRGCAAACPLQVPDLERPVVRARDRAPPVRRHRHRHDPSAMALEGRQQRARSRSQTFSVLSREPETARRPSGVTATALTPAPWPSRVASSAPCSRSQTLSVAIVRARDRAPPVRRHRHRPDPIAMALQGRQQRSAGRRQRTPQRAPARAGPRRRARRREARQSPDHRRSRGGPGAGRRAGAADGSGHGRRDAGRRRACAPRRRRAAARVLDQPVDARDLQLPAQPEVVEQQRAALVRPPGFGKVVRQVLKEIAVVRPGMPTVRTARAVGLDQLGMERRQAAPSARLAGSRGSRRAGGCGAWRDRGSRAATDRRAACTDPRCRTRRARRCATRASRRRRAARPRPPGRSRARRSALARPQ